MKLGLGLYRHLLTTENYRFARQAGATHIVAHLVNYFADEPRLPAASSSGPGWGVSTNEGALWTLDELVSLRLSIEAEGLQLEAIENLDPAHWYDILLDGPRKAQQLEDVKTIIRRMGEAGIPALGYNFSIAGVWGHVTGPFARGGAESVGFWEDDLPEQSPIPNGQFWNMQYKADAEPGTIPPVTTEQLWGRLTEFLEAVVPVAEEAGVRLAAHPDDPPMPTIRGHARLVNQPHLFPRLLDTVPSHANALEFCQGTISEMTEGNVYEAIDRYSRQGNIAYVHFRNVRGKVPHYHEVFIDEGDVDMVRAIEIYHRNGFDGVMIPDHTPQMSCDAPWHAGMAFALGYMRAVIRMVTGEAPPTA
ncbi:MAG: mannonate dehydratase [Thermomicrobiales bacterium]